MISPIFIRPKKDGSHRVIFYLKKLNEAVSYHHFKMDTYFFRYIILSLFKHGFEKFVSLKIKRLLFTNAVP